jgi:hypothetical protein
MDGQKECSQILTNFLFLKVFQTFRIAIQPAKLIIAFLAVAAICLSGLTMDYFSSTVVATPSYTKDSVTELQIYMTTPDQVQSFIEMHKQTGQCRGVFSTLWHFGSAKFQDILNSLFSLNPLGVATNISEYLRAVAWALKYHFLYCIVFFAIKLAVISIAGGGLCRITALQFAKGEKPGLTEALRFGTKKFTSFFTAPLAPIGIIIFIGLFVFVLGLIGNIPWVGELMIAVFMLLALLAGALIAVVIIGTIGGFNLMFPAIAYENSDCFDAISRSFSYVYARPWRMGFYTAIAAVYGAICYLFVRLFAFLLLSGTYLFLQLGVWVKNSSKEVNKLAAIWPAPKFMELIGSTTLKSANWPEWFAAHLIHLFSLVIVGLVVSFIISFYFSANTIIYALMRNRVDNTALEDVYTTFEEPTAEPKLDEPQAPSEPDPQKDSSDLATE